MSKLKYPQDDSARDSNACTNIQITLNGTETKPSIAVCKNGACEVSVMSHRDEEGNIVTDVHLKIIKKSEDDPGVNDIPVIDGVRGLEDTKTQSTDPHRVNSFRPLMYLHNTIPEVNINIISYMFSFNFNF